MATDINQYLPTNMKTPFWTEFGEAVNEELTRLKNRIKEKELFFDVSNLNDKAELIRIAKSLGYTPDLSLDDSLQNIKDNVNSIPFRIQNKTTYISYEYIFKTVPYPGEVFILYFTDGKLVRAATRLLVMLGELGTSAQPLNEPFTYEAEENYSDFLFSQIFLDSGRFLDSASQPWALDTFSSSSKTNHIATEYAIDRIITRDNTDYLMVSDYLSYLFNAVNYTRKVTEVPHVGSQLSLIMDESGYFDAYSNGSDAYSIPVLKLKCAVTDQYVDSDPASDMHKMIIGNGSQSLPSINESSPAWPTELGNKFAESTFIDDETEETTEWKVINTMFPANTISGEILGTGTGAVASLEGTLNHDNVRPYSVEITFDSSPESLTIIDDGQGNLFIEGEQDYAVGTINYTTGEYDFDTEKLEDVDLEVLSEVSVDSLDISLQQTNIEPTSFFLYFQIGETGFIKQDNGGGGFIDTSTGISTGSLDYNTGDLDVTFQGDTEPRQANADEHGNTQGGVTCEYQFTRQYEVDSGSDIIAQYEVEDTLEITEVGIEDASGNLLAYGTFPPLSNNSIKYHMSFQFLISKTLF